MGFIAHHEVKQRLTGDGVRVVIMSELSMGDVIGPGSGVISTEDSKVHFDFLVYPFSFPIRLGVVGGGKGKVVFQEFSQFSSKGGGELGASIGDDFVVETKAKVYFVGKECSNAFSGDIFLCRAENHPLSKPMVDHDQKGIKAGRRGEVGDEVTGDLLDRTGHGGLNGGERGNSGMCIGFVLLAGRAAFDIFADI